MEEPNVSMPGGLGSVLAERVLEIIVRNEHALGERLKEQALADALGVSRTPVRKALQYLETLGILGSNPNRGFYLAKEPGQIRKIQLPADAESDEAIYMRVVEDRLAGIIPEAIAESELMERYSLTRLQVQRVLNRMSRENLIDRKPGRGWLFRPVLDSAGSHRESYRFRMVIEPAAILEPTFKVDKALFDKVRREQMLLIDGGIERWTPAERFRSGADFHEAIVQCSNNRFLIAAMRDVNQLRRVIEYHSQTGSRKDQDRMRRQCQEHLALLDLLEAGERMEASHMLRQHLDVVRGIKTNETTPAQQSSAVPAAGRPVGVEIHL